jgi:FAD/FMN-containing dehydrogenase
LICVVSLSYDRGVEGEDQRARACFEELERSFAARGYMPYRLGIQSMHQMRTSGAYGALLQAIKSEVDPAGILSPGRYAATPMSPTQSTQSLQELARELEAETGQPRLNPRTE